MGADWRRRNGTGHASAQEASRALRRRCETHLGLAKLLCGCGEVQDVIHDLEGQPQMPPVLKHSVLHLQGMTRLLVTLLNPKQVCLHYKSQLEEFRATPTG